MNIATHVALRAHKAKECTSIFARKLQNRGPLGPSNKDFAFLCRNQVLKLASLPSDAHHHTRGCNAHLSPPTRRQPRGTLLLNKLDFHLFYSAGRGRNNKICSAMHFNTSSLEAKTLHSCSAERPPVKGKQHADGAGEQLLHEEAHGALGTMPQRIGYTQAAWVAKLGAWSKAGPRRAWAAAGTKHRDEPPLLCFNCSCLAKRTFSCALLSSERFGTCCCSRPRPRNDRRP